MNTKLSGAQLVLVPITAVGKNKFPYMENLNGRYIKYIDFYGATYLPGTATTGLTSTSDKFVTIMDEWGNKELIKNLPLERFNYVNTQGIRQAISAKISLENCYVFNQEAAAVGKIAAFVFWYDLPEYSAKNSTDSVVTDSVTIPLTTAVRYNQFPDEERMVGKRFRRVLIAAPSITPDYQSGISYSNIANVYITLRKGSYTICDNVPLKLFDQIAMQQKSEFSNIIFDFQSSYLTIGGAGTIPNVATDYIGKSVFLNLQYEK